MTFPQFDVPPEAASPSQVTVTGPPQLSLAMTDPMLGGGTCVKHDTFEAPGQAIETVLDREIVWTQVDEKPLESVAVHVRVMTSEQPEPLIESECVTVVDEQSVTTGVPVWDGSVEVGQGTTMSGGQTITGGEKSLTVSTTWHVFTLPGKVSVTRTVTEPTCDVVTVAWQAVVATQLLGPTKDAPAVLLCKDHVALKGAPGLPGDVAV
jgi:hypothetical protein